MNEVIGSATIELDMAGDIEAGLGRVIGQMGMLERAAIGAGQRGSTGMIANFRMAVPQLGQMMGLFQAGAVGMATAAVHQVGDSLRQIGGTMMGFGEEIIGTFADVGSSILQVSANFETIGVMFRRFFGDQAQDAMDRTFEIAKKTSFTTQQVAQLAMSIGRTGANPFEEYAATVTGPGGEAIQTQISALEALNDLASKRPGSDSMMRLMVSLQNFLSEGTARSAVRSLRRTFDLTGEEAKEFEDAWATGETSAEKFAAFAEVAARRFGGMGRSLENTWSFITAQFEDIRDILFFNIGQPILDKLKPLVVELKEFLEGIIDLEKESGGLKDIVGGLTDVFVAVLKPALQFFKAVVTFAVENPRITKTVLFLILALGVLSIVLGGLLVVAGTFIASLVAISLGFIVLMTAVSILIPLFLVLLPAIIGIGLAFLAWINDLGGIATFIDKVTTAFRGLWEIISTVNDIGMGRLSRETFNELEEMGLTQLVLDLGGAFFRLKTFAVAAWDGITTAANAAWRILEPLVNNLMGRLGRLFGFGPEGQGTQEGIEQTTASVGGLIDRINSISPEQWEEFGTKIGDFVLELLKHVDIIADIIDFIQAAVDAVVFTVRVLMVAFAPLIALFQLMMAQFNAVVNFVRQPLVAQAFRWATGIDLTGESARIQPKAGATNEQGLSISETLRQISAQARAAQEGDLLNKERQERNERNTRRGNRADAIVVNAQLHVDGRVLAETQANANDEEAMRLGLGR